MTVADLTEILGAGRLDRSLLHVFVAGPDEGEGILVALPGAGWIAIDGCEVGGTACLDALLSKWRPTEGDAARADPLALLVFSHPHEDHAAGIPVLLERHEPQEVMLTAASPTKPNLVKQALPLITKLKGSLTERDLARRHARAALIAIAAWAETRPERLVSGVDTVSRTWGSTTCHVRAPHECAHLETVMNELAADKREHANEASLVLELVFGSTHVVLGSDLPRVRTGTNWSIPTGWDVVLTRHPGLGQHHALKIPHHGSEHAHHASLVDSTQSRSWFVTPYRKSRLPRLDALTTLVGAQPVHATAASVDLDVPPGADLAAVPITSITRRPAVGTDAVGIGTVETTRRSHADACAPVWGIAFDDGAQVRGIWRGSSAFRITP